MAEMADYYLNQELDRMLGYYNEPKSRGAVWTTANGEALNICDMGDSHLLNCIHLSERREGHKGEEFLNNAPTYKAMVLELIRRKKMKYGYFDLRVEDRLQIRF